MTGTNSIGGESSLLPDAAPGQDGSRVMVASGTSDVSPVHAQPPGARQQYAVEWGQAIQAEIVHSAWSATPVLLITEQTQGATRTQATLAGAVGGTWHQITNIVTTADGLIHHRAFFLLISADIATAKPSGLFPSPIAAVGEMRRDRLLKLAATHFNGVQITDGEIWSKLTAAEGKAERELRVWFSPREVLPSHESYDDDAAALEALGQRVEREPGYDYHPSLFTGDRWGMLELRQRPVLRVHWLRFAYPLPNTTAVEIPQNWLRPEGRTNRVNIVPTSSPFAAPLNSFILSALGGGRTIPFMIQLAYRAGLENPKDRLPDLKLTVMRMAILSLIDDLIPAQSSSVSADGLSQSLSFESAAHQEKIDDKLESMRDSLQGIRLTVV